MNERIRSFSEFLAEQEQAELRALGIEPSDAVSQSFEEQGGGEVADEEDAYEYREEGADEESGAEEWAESESDGSEAFRVSDEAGPVEETEEADDLDALFARLMAAAQPSEPSGRSVESESDTKKDDQKESVEARLEQMQSVLAQTVQALHHMVQMMNAQTETEAFRMVARSLQAEGIILSDDQLRTIWRDAQEKGIPPSLAIKAAAYDYLTTHRNASLGELARSEPRFPFLAPRPAPQELRPNEFRKFSDYLRENS